MRPSSNSTGIFTVISLVGVRKTLHIPSSSLSRMAASSKRLAAASQGFFSFASDMETGGVNVATEEASGSIMPALCSQNLQRLQYQGIALQFHLVAAFHSE